MAVAVATFRTRPRTGPALRRTRVPFGALVLSALAHAALIVVIVVAGHVWRTTQPKTYIVNLVPAVAAIGSPQGQTRTPAPSPPRVAEPAPPRPTPAPTLPEREPVRPPDRPTRAAELPDRRPAPRESVSLPDRSLPARAPALPRPGEKELPRVASVPPRPVPSTGPVGRAAVPPPPPPPLGLPTGSVQGVGALTLNAADFPFAWYLRQIQSKISKEWESQARDGTQPQVVFDIRRDGKISGLAVEKTSGNPLYDQAALRAITDATPFPPLPDEFRESFLRVHLGFSYSGTRG
jgi:protein TonB